MGPIGNLLGMLPGMGQMKDAISQVDDRDLDRIMAIIRSMTPGERADPKILNASRKARVAKGSGVTVTEVNQLLDRFEEARKMIKQMPGMPGMGGAGRGRPARAEEGQAGQGRVPQGQPRRPRRSGEGARRPEPDGLARRTRSGCPPGAGRDARPVAAAAPAGRCASAASAVAGCRRGRRSGAGSAEDHPVRPASGILDR